jgi:hypothetical protein
MTAVKAKEKEMKDEKEAARQVSGGWDMPMRIHILTLGDRGGYRLSKIRGLKRRRRLVMRSWRRLCIRSVWRG